MVGILPTGTAEADEDKPLFSVKELTRDRQHEMLGPQNGVLVVNHYAHMSLEEDLMRRVLRRDIFYQDHPGVTGLSVKETQATLQRMVDEHKAAFLADPRPPYSAVEDTMLRSFFLKSLNGTVWAARAANRQFESAVLSIEQQRA
jgi:hypothetical protein